MLLNFDPDAFRYLVFYFIFFPLYVQIFKNRFRQTTAVNSLDDKISSNPGRVHVFRVN